MADITYQPEIRSFRRSSLDWSAIWAGLFTFVAIWSVFGFLGFAIFNGASAAAGMSVGMGIWAVVLTFIAMYIAGRETGNLAALDGRAEALTHGMVMFGLSLSAIMVLTLSGRLVFTGLFPANGLYGRAANLPNLIGYSGWFAFAALFLGWIAAMAGATTSVGPKPVQPSNVRDLRPAA